MQTRSTTMKSLFIVEADVMSRTFWVFGMVFLGGCLAPIDHEKRAAVAELDRRYQAMVPNIESYGPGGKIVLDVAYQVLREGRAEGKWSLVGLEDLWVESIQEGRTLYNDPDRRWGMTSAKETKDMLGQNTVGVWQLTVDNIKNKYGLPYGVRSDWSNAQVLDFCHEHPEIQGRMIADYVQEAYTKYGRRSPYGIQRYFWLEGYVRGWIGQGEWDKSVLATPPDRDWKKLTPEMKADTGFYAKQIVLGWRGNSRGLLYWLWVTGDQEGIREVLRIWRDQRVMVWDDQKNDAVRTERPGLFAIQPDNLKYVEPPSSCRDDLAQLVQEVLAEKIH